MGRQDSQVGPRVPILAPMSTTDGKAHSPDDFFRAAESKRPGRFKLPPDVIAAIERVISWAEEEPGRFTGFHIADVFNYVKSCTSYKPSTPEAMTRYLRMHDPDLRQRLMVALGKEP